MHNDPSPNDDWIQNAIERHAGPLSRYAASIIRDEDRARDVVQETFARLCQEPRHRVEARLAEWLFTVCRNRALDVLRKEHRMQPLDHLALHNQPAEEPTPADHAERKETTSRILRLLATLPFNQQEVIRLKFQNELSYQEISRVTQLTVSNVGFLIHTAVKNLRRQLQAQEATLSIPLKKTS